SRPSTVRRSPASHPACECRDDAQAAGAFAVTDPIRRVHERREMHLPEPRIFIVRLSAVGDCVQTMPLACALREHFPRAYLAWAVEPASAPLIAANSAVDRVVVVPKRVARS